jgi:hypothetical protein
MCCGATSWNERPACSRTERSADLRKLKPNERALLGFVIAPLLPALILTLPAVPRQEPGTITRFIAYAAVSYCATLLIAVPAHLQLRERHWTLLSLYVAVGGIVGLAVFLFLYISGMPSHVPGLGSLGRRLLSLPVDMIGGVVILICFWLIARPDRA